MARPHALQLASTHLPGHRAVSLSCCFLGRKAKRTVAWEPRSPWTIMCGFMCHSFWYPQITKSEIETQCGGSGLWCSEAEAGGSRVKGQPGCTGSPSVLKNSHRIWTKLEISNLNTVIYCYSIPYSKWHLMSHADLNFQVILKKFSNNFHFSPPIPSAWTTERLGLWWLCDIGICLIIKNILHCHTSYSSLGLVLSY